MNSPQPLTVDESSRLAVTATAADLEYWARSVAIDGWVRLDELVDFLDSLRAVSTPRHTAPTVFSTLSAS